MLRKLVASGIDVARLNLSHGALSDHLAVLADLRVVAKEAGRLVAVLADLPGPKLRTGAVPEGGLELADGELVRLVPAHDPCSPGRITVEGSLDGLAVNDQVVLGDGAISMVVTDRDGDCLHAVVGSGGRIQGRPGVHLPSNRLAITSPTDDDLVLARAMADAGVDFLALSFVRSGDDVRRLREAVGADCPPIVAKIETAAALDDLDSVLAAADAVMVARGDLGLELPLEDLPHLQKKIVRGCVSSGVPVIIATQMLESMIESPSPTRAEVSDVANAVFDGADALMLSAETAVGHDPALVVRTMSRIAERAEVDADYKQWGARLGALRHLSVASGASLLAEAMSHAAWQAITDVDASAVICCTRSGSTARQMARYRPTAMLLGVSPSEETLRRLALSWGIRPLLVNMYHSTDELVWHAVEAAVKANLVHPGETIAVLAGAPDTTDGGTDVLRLVRVK